MQYKENFGLINRTYPGEGKGGALGDGHKPTQWQRFYHELIRLNRQSPENMQYKVFFFGRHGEGYHNAAESYFGTPAWNVSNLSVFPYLACQNQKKRKKERKKKPSLADDFDQSVVLLG